MSISGTELVSSKFVDLVSGELISLHRLYALKMIFDRNLENRFFFYPLPPVPFDSYSLSRVELCISIFWIDLLFFFLKNYHFLLF